MNPPLSIGLSLLLALMGASFLLGMISGVGTFMDWRKRVVKKLVYVAGPLSTGNTMHNVREAVTAGTWIMQNGHAAYVPHVNVLWDMIQPHEYESWIDLCFDMLRRSDAMLRLPGPCPGCEREEALAKELGIPVFHNFTELKRWLDG